MGYLHYFHHWVGVSLGPFIKGTRLVRRVQFHAIESFSKNAVSSLWNLKWDQRCLSQIYVEDDLNTKFCKSQGLGSIETGTTHIEEFSYKDRSFLKMMDKSSRKIEVIMKLCCHWKWQKEPSLILYLTEEKLLHLLRKLVNNPKLFKE